MEDVTFIDFHSHILPGADHGSDSVKTSAVQLSMAKAAGLEKIVATPHFYPNLHTVKDFLVRRNRAYQNLNMLAESKNIEVILSAEVLLCEGIEELPDIDKLAVRGTNVLLIELPFSRVTNVMFDSVEALIKKGFNVVIAHADRYKPADIERVISLGAKIQLNADALSGLLIRKHLKKWLTSGIVVALGSDIHGVNKKYYKRFVKAANRIKDFGVFEKCKNILNEAQLV